MPLMMKVVALNARQSRANSRPLFAKSGDSAFRSAIEGTTDRTSGARKPSLLARIGRSWRRQSPQSPGVSVSQLRHFWNVQAGLAEAIDDGVDQVIGEVPTSVIIAHPCQIVAGAMSRAAGMTVCVR